MPSWVRWTGAAAYVVFAAVLAAHRYRTAGVPSDFEVFWRAGDRFLHGAPLYPPGPIDTAFLYPPFAAFLFQVLALVPLSLAAAIASFGNTLLYLAALWLTWDVIRTLLPAANTRRWALLVGAGLSFRFFQNNAAWIQTNLVTFVLVLVGVAAGTRRRWPLTAAALAAAAGIKVVPAILLVWLLVRGPRRAVVPAIALAVAAVVLVPLLWRGPAQGGIDLTEYVRGFLSAYLGGAVRVRWDNYNLATLVYAPFVALGDPAGVIGPWLPGGPRVAAWLYRIAAVVVVGSWLVSLIVLARRRVGWTAHEIAATLLAALLLSGVTWTHHLVTLLFVYTVIVASVGMSHRGVTRVVLWVALALGVTSGLGRDVVGATLYDGLRAFHVLALFLAVGFIATVALSLEAPSLPRG